MKGFYDLHIGIQSWNGIPTCVPRAEIEKKNRCFTISLIIFVKIINCQRSLWAQKKKPNREFL